MRRTNDRVPHKVVLAENRTGGLGRRNTGRKGIVTRIRLQESRADQGVDFLFEHLDRETA